MILHKIPDTLLNFLHFSSFLTQKMAAILNFEKFLRFFFQKAQLDPREVIVWKFEDPMSNGLVAIRETLYSSSFLTPKMVTILNFEMFFTIFFQKAQLDPREVIVWKFEDPTSNGLVATQGTYTHTHKHTHKVNTRTNLFQQSWLLHWLWNYCWRFPITIWTGKILFYLFK